MWGGVAVCGLGCVCVCVLLCFCFVVVVVVFLFCFFKSNFIPCFDLQYKFLSKLCACIIVKINRLFIVFFKAIVSFR